MRILQVINIANFTLAVYYTSGFCYQYCVIDPEGAECTAHLKIRGRLGFEGSTVYDFDDIFYTASSAEREGREAIRVALNL